MTLPGFICACRYAIGAGCLTVGSVTSSLLLLTVMEVILDGFGDPARPRRRQPGWRSGNKVSLGQHAARKVPGAD